MSKRYVVLGLSLVLALALAVPALGGPSNPIASISASVKKTANKALKTAKQAKKQAKNALNKANGAQSSANDASAAAKKAQESADGAQASANSAKGTADEAKALAEKAEANANTKVSGVYYQFGEPSEENTETTKNASAFCEGSDEATGGGYAFAGSTNVTVSASTPTFYGDGWFVTAKAISGTPTWAIQANTVCTEY